MKNPISNYLINKSRIGEIIICTLTIFIIIDLIFNISDNEGFFQHLPSIFGIVYWVTLFAVGMNTMRSMSTNKHNNGYYTYTLATLFNIMTIVWSVLKCSNTNGFSIFLFVLCYVIGISLLMSYYFLFQKYYLNTVEKISTYINVNVLLVNIGIFLSLLANDSLGFLVYCLPTNGMFFYLLMENNYHWLYFVNITILMVVAIITIKMIKSNTHNHKSSQEE